MVRVLENDFTSTTNNRHPQLADGAACHIKQFEADVDNHRTETKAMRVQYRAHTEEFSFMRQKLVRFRDHEKTLLAKLEVYESINNNTRNNTNEKKNHIILSQTQHPLPSQGKKMRIVMVVVVVLRDMTTTPPPPPSSSRYFVTSRASGYITGRCFRNYSTHADPVHISVKDAPDWTRVRLKNRSHAPRGMTAVVPDRFSWTEWSWRRNLKTSLFSLLWLSRHNRYDLSKTEKQIKKLIDFLIFNRVDQLFQQNRTQKLRK